MPLHSPNSVNVPSVILLTPIPPFPGHQPTPNIPYKPIYILQKIDSSLLKEPDNGNFTLSQTFAAQTCSLAPEAFQLKFVCATSLDALAMCYYCVILELDDYLGKPSTVLYFIQSAIRLQAFTNNAYSLSRVRCIILNCRQ